MTGKTKIVIGGVALAVAAWGAGLVWDFFDRSSISHQAIQVWLKMIGEGIYEYHSTTGNWPASVEDLAQTSLPRKFPLWKSTARNIVFFWPKDLKIDPKENGPAMLGYYSEGLVSKLGRVWVLFGDLRTEYVPIERVKH